MLFADAPEIRIVQQQVREFAALLYQIDVGELPSETAIATRFRTSRITIGRGLRELKQRGLLTGVAGPGNFVAGTGQATKGSSSAC